MIFQDMDRIVFAGDSVTDMGSVNPVGEGLFDNLGHSYVRVIENLFTMDLAYLQDMYQRINMSEMPHYQLTCPHCNQQFEVPLDFLLG